MKYIVGLLCGLNLLLCSCQIKRYGEGVEEDTKRIFTANKDYMYRLSIGGIVENKAFCNNCDINKYTLELRLNHISEKPDISKMQYSPYYFFKGDSILIISVTKNLFDKINVNDRINKEMKDFEISVNDMRFLFLNKEKYKWLP